MSKVEVKTPGITDLKEINFLYSPHINTNGKTKEEVRTALKINRHNFVPSTGINTLLDTINQGYTVQLGYGEGAFKTANLEEVDKIDICVIDFDNAEMNADIYVKLDELLCIDFIKNNVAFYQESISSTSDRVKVHFFMRFDRTLGVEEYNKVVVPYILGELKKSGYKFDKSGFIANQPIFAGKGECKIINLENNLVTKLIIEESNKVPKHVELDNPRNQRQCSNLTSEVLNYLYEQVFIGECEEEIEKLYCLYGHDFVERESLSDYEIDKKIIKKVEGSNPFSATNNSGISFVVSYIEGELPYWCDRSMNIETSNLKNGGSYIEYWYQMGKLSGKYTKGLKEIFKDVVKEICDHFRVERFDFRKSNSRKEGTSNKSKDEFNELLDEIIEDVKVHFHKKIYFLESNHYFGFIEKRGQWEFLQCPNKVYAAVFVEYIREKYGDKIAGNIKVRSAVTNFFSIFSETNKVKTEIVYYVPLMNGVFNLKTKQLEKNVGQAHNKGLYPWEITPESLNFDTPVINDLKRMFHEWTRSEVKGELLLTWLILNVQKQAYKTGAVFGVIGASGKGKTTYCRFIRNLINGVNIKENYSGESYATAPDTKLFTSGYAHATALLEGKSYIHLEEFKGNNGNQSADVIKALSGNQSSNTITINPKGQKQREVDYYGSITFDSEDLPNLPASEAGYYRRITFIEIDDSFSVLDAGKLHRWVENEEIGNNIIAWCLHQDTETLLKRYDELSKHHEMRESSKNVRLESSGIGQFIDETFVVTDDENDVIKSNDMYTLYNQLCVMNGYGKQYSNKTAFSKVIKRLLGDKDLFGWKGDTKPIRQGEEVQRCFTHLKYKSDCINDLGINNDKF